jgi:glyoxalase superfamily protein
MCSAERTYDNCMVAFVKSVTFDCESPLVVAAFWAAALGSNVDDDSTEDRAWVEPAGWGGPNMWFQRVPEEKTAKNRQHFDLRAIGDLRAEVDRLRSLGATIVREGDDSAVMQDPEGNEFCVEV